MEQDKLDGSPGRPGIVLFDELEKASPEVVHALLNVLDNGLLRVASGERTYHFRNTLVFMTSNLAPMRSSATTSVASACPGACCRSAASAGGGTSTGWSGPGC